MSATAEGKMSATADGKADGKSGGNSSYAMLPSDRKTVAMARTYAEEFETQIADAKKDFTRKGSFGLWWDAKGLFSSSNVADVTEHVERYRKFYEGVGAFTAMVEKGDPKSYERLLELYAELSEMEIDAERDVKKSKSKTTCRILRNILNEKYKLNHNMKKVECVVLKQKIGQVEQNCMEAISKMREDMKEYVRESNERAKESQVENQTLKLLVEGQSREKEEFKEAMEREKEELKEAMEREKEELKEAMDRKMEKLSSEANRRCEAVRRESDRKLKDMLEEAQNRSEEITQKMAERQMQNIKQMLENMKFNNCP